jgi:copper chaperone
MTKETFHIPNISCGHCTGTIERELKALDGIKSVRGDIQAKTVTVEYEAPMDKAKILATLKEINYPAA